MFVEEMSCRYSAANCGSRESTNARAYNDVLVGTDQSQVLLLLGLLP
jgi:hypothetical protein